MSFSNSVPFQGQYQTQPIQFGSKSPIGGARCVTVNLTLPANQAAPTQPQLLDLSTIGQNFSAIVAVEIDNRLSGYACRLTFPDSGQAVICPPFSRAVYAVETNQLKCFVDRLQAQTNATAVNLLTINTSHQIRFFNTDVTTTFEAPSFEISDGDILVPRRTGSVVLVSNITGNGAAGIAGFLPATNLPYAFLTSFGLSLQVSNTNAGVEQLTIELADQATPTANAFVSTNLLVPSGYSSFQDLINVQNCLLFGVTDFTWTITPPTGVLFVGQCRFVGGSTNFPDNLYPN